MIQCENLVKIYKTSEIEVLALQGLDLSIAESELMAIIGNSGSGKSTLMNIIGGIDRPTAGKITVAGLDLLAFEEQDLIDYRRNTVGFVWQNPARNLIPYLDALHNVEIPMTLAKKADRRKRAEELLDLVGLSHRMKSRPQELSGGEQQRVAIAIGLANSPKLLLADEPTGNVDTATADMIFKIFREINQAMGVTIVIVTHDRRVSKAVDRYVAIRDGKTSSEFVRRRAYRSEFSSLGDFSNHPDDEDEIHEELTVLDRAGRLQIPAEYLEDLGLKGKDKVKVEVEGKKIILTAPQNEKVNEAE